MPLFSKQPESSPSAPTKKSFLRYVDTQAWSTSLTLHALLLFVLAGSSIALPPQNDELDLSYQPVELPEEETPLPLEFLSAEEPREEIGALSQAGELGALAAAMELNERSLVIFEPEEATDFGERLVVEAETPVFQGPELSNRLSAQGASSVGETGAVGAIDRLTHELTTAVELEPTLVVWMFDQSGSLKQERNDILERFQRIYEELGVIKIAKNPEFNNAEEKPLLTAVAGFGEQVELLTTKPTDRIEEIEDAIRAIRDSDSPTENVFQSIAALAQKYRAFRLSSKKRRHVMIIVFTDEAGDDASRHEATIDICRRLGIPVYVVGRPAPFGRQHAHVKWIDPDPNFDQRPQWVPVRLGPETQMPERLKLPFLFASRRERLLDSGYGPYGLTKLCNETGGLYFSVHPNRTIGRGVSARETPQLTAHFTEFFDPDVMRKYQPDYVPEREYHRRLQQNRARAALVEAAQMSWVSPVEDIRNIRTRFVKQEEAQFARDLSVAQRAAALRQPELDRLCEILLRGEVDRPKIKSLRWEAGFDLALGRSLATKVRNEGYNAMLALAKQGLQFTKQENNAWNLQPDEQFANSSLEQMAEKARNYLQQVVEEHPGTPWASLARRELRQPLGWRWSDSRYDPPSTEGSAEPPKTDPPPRPPRRDPPPL